MDAVSVKDFNLVMETDNPANKITFQWSIRNIHKLPGIIRSCKFSLVPGQPGDWDVSIRRESNGKFEFYLGYHAQNNAVPIRVESHSRILKNEISVLVRDYPSVHLFNSGDRLPLLTGVVFPKESEDDKLVFQCFMTVRGYGLDCSRDLYSDDGRRDVEQLRKDFLKILKSKEFADVAIKVEDICYTAHRCVLKSLAPKFYDAHLDDILGGMIRLTHDWPETIRMILKGIYFGREVRTIASALYANAVQYYLRSLIRSSTRELILSMNTANVCQYYQLAEDNEDEDLTDYCELFMKDNLRELESSECYKIFSADRPHLPRSIRNIN